MTEIRCLLCYSSGLLKVNVLLVNITTYFVISTGYFAWQFFRVDGIILKYQITFPMSYFYFKHIIYASTLYSMWNTYLTARNTLCSFRGGRESSF